MSNIRITETRVYQAIKADPNDTIEYRHGGFVLLSVSRPSEQESVQIQLDTQTGIGNIDERSNQLLHRTTRNNESLVVPRLPFIRDAV